MAASGRKLNKLASTVAKLTSPLPKEYKAWGYTFAFDSWVSEMMRCPCSYVDSAWLGMMTIFCYVTCWMMMMMLMFVEDDDACM